MARHGVVVLLVAVRDSLLSAQYATGETQRRVLPVLRDPALLPMLR